MDCELEMRLTAVAELTAEEVAAITLLVNQANENFRYVFSGSRLGPSSLVEQYSDSRVLVGYEGHLAVGTATLRGLDDGLVVSLLAVHPGHRGRGFGRVLLEEAERVARQKRLAWLKLDAVDTGRLVAYYLSIGFEEFERTQQPIGHWGASAPFDLVHMRRATR